MIKAIIFDCFGVLTNDGWREIREEYCVTPELIKQALAIDTAVNSGGMDYDEFISRIEQLTGLSKAEVLRKIDTRNNNEQLFVYIRDVLKPNYKIALLSNAASNWLSEMFAPWQVKVFDTVTLSYSVGAVKPQPEIYQDSLTKLGIEANEAIFVDDVVVYCVSAKSLGMQAIEYRSFDYFTREMERLL